MCVGKSAMSDKGAGQKWIEKLIIPELSSFLLNPSTIQHSFDIAYGVISALVSDFKLKLHFELILHRRAINFKFLK